VSEGVFIRHLRESDHRNIISVVDEWWGGRSVSGKLPRLFFRHFRNTSFVAEEGGEVVAFLVGFAGDLPGEAYIHFVGVRPDRRGRRIARRLYGEFFDEVRRRGCRRVRCITSPVNGSSIAFHERMGFEILPGDGEVGGSSVHEDYDGDGMPKVVFEKVLG
jgi:ribosomal protein S18 acetylase RimI-like enzyme